MADEVESVYITKRVKDIPIPFLNSEKGTCSRCGEEVWMDPKARAYWMKYPIICAPNCLNELLKEKPGPHTIKIPDAVLESLREIMESQKNLRENL